MQDIHCMERMKHAKMLLHIEMWVDGVPTKNGPSDQDEAHNGRKRTMVLC